VYRNGNLYAVHTDQLGTPRSITDAAKQPVWQWPYSAFGDNKPTGPLSTIQTTSTTGATSTQLKATTPTLNFSLRYPGLYCDDESQLCYNWWRSYRPFDAGFTQMDPAGLSAGPNRRIYAHHNALRYTDRSGLNAVAGAEAGAEIGSAFGPVGTVVGGLLGAGVGAWIGWNVAGPMLANHRKTLMTHLGRRPRASPGKRKASRIPKAVKIGCLIPTPAEGGRATDGKTIEGESGARPDRAAGRMAGRTGMFSGLTGVTPTFRRAQTLMT
jgi:RHS repeat-associated protein